MNERSEDVFPRVLMVDSETTWRGGEGQLLLLMTGLCEAGCSVALTAAPDSEIRKRSSHLSVEFFPLSVGGGADVVSAWRLRSMLSNGKFDIVHSHSSHAHSVAWLACSGLGSRRPVQVVSRRVDFSVAANALSRLKYRHGADAYLAISHGVRDVLVECGIEPERIRLVPSGIDLGKFDNVRANHYLDEEFSIAPDTRVVGNIAALAPHKSQSDLIHAARIVRDCRDDVRFFIVGEGKLERSLKELTARLCLDDCITFTGFRRDVLELLTRFDCFVLSSYLEGLGTSIMDAHAAGIPVVATRTGGIVDIVHDGETGLLVPPRDPDSLAAALLRMLDDNSLRNKCITTAREQSHGYDYRQMVYKTLDAYLNLLGSGRESSPLKGYR